MSTPQPIPDKWPCGCRKLCRLCDLGVFVDQAAEPVPSQDPDIRAQDGRMLASGGRALAERPMRAMNVIVLDVFPQDQPQLPVGAENSVQATDLERSEAGQQ